MGWLWVVYWMEVFLVLVKFREEGGFVKNIGFLMMLNGDFVVLVENIVIDIIIYN